MLTVARQHGGDHTLRGRMEGTHFIERKEGGEKAELLQARSTVLFPGPFHPFPHPLQSRGELVAFLARLLLSDGLSEGGCKAVAVGPRSSWGAGCLSPRRKLPPY